MQAIELSRQLHARGHTVWLAAPGGSRIAQEATRHRLLPLAVRGYVHPFLAWHLARFIKANRVDVIHCQHSRDLATVIPARQLAGGTVPVLLSKRMGSYIQKKDLFHRYTYARVRYVLAISNVINRNVLDTTPMTPDRVLTLYDAVDLPEVHNLPRTTDSPPGTCSVFTNKRYLSALWEECPRARATKNSCRRHGFSGTAAALFAFSWWGMADVKKKRNTQAQSVRPAHSLGVERPRHVYRIPHYIPALTAPSR